MGTGYDQGCADFRGVFARCMSLHLAEADIPAQSNGAGFDVVDGARSRHRSAIGWSS